MKLFKSAKEPEIYHYFDTKGNKLWMFRHKYYDSLGKRKEKKKSGFTTEKAALKALLEVKAATLRGDTKHIENDNMTVAQWLDIWFETNSPKWKETTRVQREHIIRLHLKPLLGHHKLQKLDTIMYKRDCINVVATKFKPKTVKMWHALFKIAINAAVENEILTRNRFGKVALPIDEEKESLNFYTADELVILLDDIKQNENITNYTILLLLSYTGIRKGEAVGMQWKSIDFTQNTISIIQTRDEKGTRSPKTRNSYRTILVDEDVISQLKVYKTWCKQTKLRYGEKLNDSDLVFISKEGMPVYTQVANHVLKMAIKRTGLKKITVHGLRHTHATILLNQGREVKVIANRLGNTPDMIYNIYGHVMKNLEIDSVNVFSGVLKESGAKIGASGD